MDGPTVGDVRDAVVDVRLVEEVQKDCHVEVREGDSSGHIVGLYSAMPVDLVLLTRPDQMSRCLVVYLSWSSGNDCPNGV